MGKPDGCPHTEIALCCGCCHICKIVMALGTGFCVLETLLSLNKNSDLQLLVLSSLSFTLFSMDASGKSSVVGSSSRAASMSSAVPGLHGAVRLNGNKGGTTTCGGCWLPVWKSPMKKQHQLVGSDWDVSVQHWGHHSHPPSPALQWKMCQSSTSHLPLATHTHCRTQI